MVDYNQAITFGPAGSINALDPIGFDLTEEGPHCWTIRQCCEFEVTLPMPRQEVTMRIEAQPFLVAGKIASQQLFVYINGLFQGFHTFSTGQPVSFPVLRNAISSRATRVQLVIPTAVSPQALGLSADIRELGLAITAITFSMN